MKNPLTPDGVKPATFRFVAQHLNHGATAVPRLWGNAEKFCTAGQVTDGNMAHEHCILDTKGYKHTLRTCNTYCFSAATMVARTRLSITLFVHCLSCCKLSSTVWRAIIVICAPFRVRKLDMPVGLRCCCLVALWVQISQKKVLTLEKENGDKFVTKIYTINKLSSSWPDQWFCLYPPICRRELYSQFSRDVWRLKICGETQL
jgi:hypothetical protein